MKKSGKVKSINKIIKSLKVIFENDANAKRE